MEPVIPSPEDAIAHLADSSEPLLNTRLADLNNLTFLHLELLKKAWSDISQDRRLQIIHRLVEMVEDDIELNFDSIFKYLLKDADENVRALAIEGLWENEEPSRIEQMIALMENDPSEKVQTAAALALGHFTTLAEHDKIRSAYKSRLVQALLNTHSDRSKAIDVRRRSLEAVSPISLPEVKNAIKSAYHGSDDRLKISAVYAMGKSCDLGWLPDLFRELTSPNAELRYEAAGALGDLEEESAVGGLTNLIDDPDIEVRMAAIQALGKIATTQAKATLKHCLESNNEAARDAAEQALAELAEKEDPLHLKL